MDRRHRRLDKSAATWFPTASTRPAPGLLSAPCWPVLCLGSLPLDVVFCFCVETENIWPIARPAITVPRSLPPLIASPALSDRVSYVASGTSLPKCLYLRPTPRPVRITSLPECHPNAALISRVPNLKCVTRPAGPLPAPVLRIYILFPVGLLRIDAHRHLWSPTRHACPRHLLLHRSGRVHR